MLRALTQKHAGILNALARARAAYTGDRLLATDVADLLNHHGMGGLLVSFLAATALAATALSFIAGGEIRHRLVYTWWALMAVVLLLRAVDIRKFRHSRGVSALSGQIQLRLFGIGVVMTGILWAAFSFAFFREMSPAGRACTAIVLSAMIGGSASALAPSKKLSVIYCACLSLPPSSLFLYLGGKENTFLGVLGCTFFIVMTVSSRFTHRATVTAVRMSRTNETLALETQTEPWQPEEMKVELTAEQEVGRGLNCSLEHRMEARTADLDRGARQKERYAKELAYLASTDSLTGLCNRHTLAKRLSLALERAENRNQALAVLFVDLDKFKEVNDIKGHLAGDKVLQTVAQRLADSLPANVELARWGGDEFVIALPVPSGADAAVQLASTLRERLCQPIQVDLGFVTIDATVGISLFPDHGRSQQDLILAADMAMYAGKEERHSKIRLFDPLLSHTLAERLSMEQALREAIEMNSLSLVFQPIISAQTRLCAMVEALVRWQHPERGEIHPSQFIPIAERIGEIASIGRWVLVKACHEAAAWRDEEAPAVSVNVSATQVESGSFVLDVLNALEESALPAHRLQLELTESVFAGDQERITLILKSLREKGVRISLDDFGTGFSGLSFLRRLPIDAIKIDKSFVEAVNGDSAPIVRVIVTTAQTFGFAIVAEGVETAAQAESLIALGVDYLQGYLFSSPLSPQVMLEQFGARSHQRFNKMSNSA